MECMSTDVTLEISSTGSNDTERIGEALGKSLKGGEVIELVSDLGGGKTTLVRGIAKGAGSLDTVASPSFTIKREYYARDLTIHHFDFYRLKEPGLIQHDLAEALENPNDIVVIEWADIVQGVLPKDRVTIQSKVTSPDGRKLSVRVPSRYAYLLEGLK